MQKCENCNKWKSCSNQEGYCSDEMNWNDKTASDSWCDQWIEEEESE